MDIKIDGRNAYLNLSNVQTNEGIEFYITAEATYALVLVPDNISSETIVLKAGLKDRGAAVTWEKAHDYVKSVKELVKGMETGVVPPGYRHIEFNMKEAMWQEADVTLISEYSGGAMHGRIYRIKNISKADIRFGENEFYKKGIRAISVKLSTLKPGETTVVYLVGDGRAWGNLVKTPLPALPMMGQMEQQNYMLPSAPDVRGE